MTDIPPAWFVEPLIKMTSEIYKNSVLKAGALRLVVSRDLGLRLGIAPGRYMKIATPAGDVEVQSESGQLEAVEQLRIDQARILLDLMRQGE